MFTINFNFCDFQTLQNQEIFKKFFSRDPKNAPFLQLWPQGMLSESQKIKPVKQKKPGDRLLPPSVRDLVPESQAYSDLLHLERKVKKNTKKK